MTTAFEVARIIAYFTITCAGAYLYFDDSARHRGSRFVWGALGFEHIAMLFFLAMDLQYVVDWLSLRASWIFTPFAAYVALATLIVAAITMLVYAVRRYLDRRRMRGVLRKNEGL